MANYIVLKMDLNDKWWDKWFVVAGLSIDRSICCILGQQTLVELHVM